MGTVDLSNVCWRKSSRTEGANNCVELACCADGGGAVRDSKNRSGPVIALPEAGFVAFLRSVRAGSPGS